MVDGRGKTLQRKTIYRVRALTHPLQGLVAALFVFVWAMSGHFSSGLMASLAMELLLVLALPRIGAFQRSVDSAIVRAANELALRTRVDSLERMSEHHRDELERIERRASELREDAHMRDEPCEDEHGLDDLLGVYASLAIAHRESNTVFAPLTIEVESDESDDENDPEVVRWSAQRARLVRVREEVRREVTLERRRIEEQLATISALVDSVYESSVLERLRRANEAGTIGLWGVWTLGEEGQAAAPDRAAR